MPRDSMYENVRRYRSLADHWVESRAEELSADLIDDDRQLCHDILVDDLERLKEMCETADQAIKSIRYYGLAIRQDEGRSADVEASWREHAVNHPPISYALWAFINDGLLTAGRPNSEWERGDWIPADAPAWMAELVEAASGVCWTPQCFMRCRPTETANLMKHHGIWSHGNDLYVMDEIEDAPFYTRMNKNRRDYTSEDSLSDL